MRHINMDQKPMIRQVPQAAMIRSGNSATFSNRIQTNGGYSLTKAPQPQRLMPIHRLSGVVGAGGGGPPIYGGMRTIGGAPQMRSTPGARAFMSGSTRGGGGVQRVMSRNIRVDSAGNKYVQLPNGQFQQVRTRVLPYSQPSAQSQQPHFSMGPMSGGRIVGGGFGGPTRSTASMQSGSAFTFGEAEDREINEAIAQQEHLMRMEDGGGGDPDIICTGVTLPPPSMRRLVGPGGMVSHHPSAGFNRFLDERRRRMAVAGLDYQRSQQRYIGISGATVHQQRSIIRGIDPTNGMTMYGHRNYPSPSPVGVRKVVQSGPLATNITPTDSEEMKQVKLTVRDMVDEICFDEDRLMGGGAAFHSQQILSRGSNATMFRVGNKLINSSLGGGAAGGTALMNRLNAQRTLATDQLRSTARTVFSSIAGGATTTLSSSKQQSTTISTTKTKAYKSKETAQERLLAGVVSYSSPLTRFTDDQLNTFVENFKKEVNKRRVVLERRAEEEVGLQTPWRRTRTKNVNAVKTTKKAKKELENALELCDPRFITLGSTNVQTDLPLKLELDMSGNAKITTASKWLTDEKNDGGGSRRGRNDNTDDDQSDETDQELLKENTVAPANAKRKAAVNVRPSLASIGRRRAKSAATRAIERRRQQRERSRQTQVKREKQQQKRAASTSNSEGEEDDEMMEEEEENTEQILRASSSCAHHNNGDEETTYIGGKSNIAASMSAVSCGSGGKSSARRNGAGWSHRKNRNQSQRAAQRRHQQAAALLAHNPAPALLKPPRVLSSAERFDTTKTEEDGGGSAASATTTAFSASNADGVSKYCPCGSSYDPKKFYISCDECKHWYHGKCVNVTEKKAQKLAEEAQVASGNAAAAVADGRTPSGWICAECERERSKESAELYCVCRRPYNDKQFYVGCDSCEDWFHPECIGTTQAEVEKCDSFLCPKCRETVPGADEEMF